MNELFLFDNLWVPLGLWAVLYVSDYTLTLYGAQLYQGRAKEHLVIEGSYELNPYFQQEVNQLRPISLRFLVALLASCLLLLIVRGLADDWPWLFVFACGGLILMEAAVHCRHLRNIATFRQMNRGEGVRGRIEYSRWFTYRTSAVDMFAFAAIFLALAVIVRSWFCLGGTASCTGLAVRHYLQSNRTRPQAD
jgi:hypothetical protein